MPTSDEIVVHNTLATFRGRTPRDILFGYYALARESGSNLSFSDWLTHNRRTVMRTDGLRLPPCADDGGFQAMLDAFLLNCALSSGAGPAGDRPTVSFTAETVSEDDREAYDRGEIVVAPDHWWKGAASEIVLRSRYEVLRATTADEVLRKYHAHIEALRGDDDADDEGVTYEQWFEHNRRCAIAFDGVDLPACDEDGSADAMLAHLITCQMLRPVEG